MSDEPQYLGSVSGTLDLAPPLAAGLKLRLQGISVPAATQRQAVPFARDDTGMLLSVCSMVEGSAQALGTAFLVAPGLAMTAAHVIADYQDAGRLEAGPLLLVGAYEGKLRAWAASRARVPVEGDVALVELVPRFVYDDEVVINHVELTARLPAVGEPVVAFGLIAQAKDFPFDAENGEAAMITVEGLAASGTVQEFYEHRGILNRGPVLRCDFKAPGGMSGGPVFDRDGKVFGILTSSMPVEDEWESYVSLHWAAIMFETQPEWPEHFYKQPGTLWPGHVAENWHLGIGADRSIAYFPD